LGGGAYKLLYFLKRECLSVPYVEVDGLSQVQGEFCFFSVAILYLHGRGGFDDVLGGLFGTSC